MCAPICFVSPFVPQYNLGVEIKPRPLYMKAFSNNFTEWFSKSRKKVYVLGGIFCFWVLPLEKIDVVRNFVSFLYTLRNTTICCFDTSANRHERANKHEAASDHEARCPTTRCQSCARSRRTAAPTLRSTGARAAENGFVDNRVRPPLARANLSSPQTVYF